MMPNISNAPTEQELEELIKLIEQQVQVTVRVTGKDDFNELVSSPIHYQMKLAVVKPGYIEGWLTEPRRAGLSIQPFYSHVQSIPYTELLTCIKHQGRVIYQRTKGKR